MEDEKKKKKNKKKKNKQTKTTGDVVTHGIGESTYEDQNHVIEHNHHYQVLETTDVQNEGPKTDVDLDLDRRCINGTKDSSVFSEAEKLYWMDKGASLEETIKKIQKENDTHIQKGACLEEKITTLQKENAAHIQKEASLEETIKNLQKENDAHMQKEASFEMKLLQLQSERGSWLQKEAGFEEKINKLIDETAILSLKGLSLEEKIKQMEGERDSWVQKENSTKETVDSLSGDNTRLQAKVMELEESGNYLLRENQQLAESMSGLQSQIQNLEKSIASAHTSTMQPMHASGGEDTNTQMDAAQQLVEKLVTENAELVEKVNELYVELDQQGVTSDLSQDVGSELTAGTAEKIYVADSISEFSKRTSAYDERPDSPKHVLIKDTSDCGDGVNAKDIAHIAGSIADSMEDVAIKAEGDDGEYIYAKDTAVIPNSPDTVDSEEIVQIPLDENEVGDPGLQLTHDDQTIHVPITDAPLIGAPFRLISFVARYVSGADLVSKSSVNSETVNSHE
ncbi:rootletin-like isoform X1 [Camellia sinensis]|uniref:rootletin-like isoform X1 n=1 Tax=Camellia sinensis TaxID=4442 RepID=UPI001035F84E|nr:rootletin-like isoform X1 [Camellia sinensis]XP_028097840.1 rootletin-like isoform X1 [Camellia sinensis]XP_028097841.1 rootletin-like isoform X1 [Camellia sinensis]XP_028097842.1 rootletin-like isoform X1 [Camellia sinensis]XP_028097843.1 rootletin-like isoform X1 [Camellia sinensis]